MTGNQDRIQAIIEQVAAALDARGAEEVGNLTVRIHAFRILDSTHAEVKWDATATAKGKNRHIAVNGDFILTLVGEKISRTTSEYESKSISQQLTLDSREDIGYRESSTQVQEGPASRGHFRRAEDDPDRRRRGGGDMDKETVRAEIERIALLPAEDFTPEDETSYFGQLILLESLAIQDRNGYTAEAKQALQNFAKTIGIIPNPMLSESPSCALITLEEASKRHGVSLSSLYTAIHRGRVAVRQRQPFPGGGKILVDESELVWYLQHKPKGGRRKQPA